MKSAVFSAFLNKLIFFFVFVDNLISPCLWVGTALGNVFVVVLNLPVGDQRESQPVLTITTGNRIFCTEIKA